MIIRIWVIWGLVENTLCIVRQLVENDANWHKERWWCEHGKVTSGTPSPNRKVHVGKNNHHQTRVFLFLFGSTRRVISFVLILFKFRLKKKKEHDQTLLSFRVTQTPRKSWTLSLSNVFSSAFWAISSRNNSERLLKSRNKFRVRLDYDVILHFRFRWYEVRVQHA